MKKIILVTLIALFTTISTSAQEKGGVAAIAAINIYASSTTIVGIGIGGRYGLTDVLRLESSIVALLKAGSSIDFNAEVQYLIPIQEGWDFYPLAGLSVNDIKMWSMGIKLGAGTDYSITENWGVFGGVKWMIQTAKYSKNPIVINAGVSYKF